MVLLKALYLLCGAEGYALDTLWMNSLSDLDRNVTRSIISSRFEVEVPDRIHYFVTSLQWWILSV